MTAAFHQSHQKRSHDHPATFLVKFNGGNFILSSARPGSLKGMEIALLHCQCESQGGRRFRQIPIFLQIISPYIYDTRQLFILSGKTMPFGCAQSELTLPRSNRSIVRVMEYRSPGNEIEWLWKLPESVEVLFSIIPLLHHSIAPEEFRND
jgi:hypothetical protein